MREDQQGYRLPMPGRLEKLPSNCPQNASRDGKKSWRNRISTRRAKSLSLQRLDDKTSCWQSLRKRGRTNPSLSVEAFHGCMRPYSAPAKPPACLLMGSSSARTHS
jgi:hypothetical protein